ncbi:MAG: helicase [Paludibacter sp. 47-17]|nr:MAG: helicase [Paludibacter sp. 47-17]
MNDLIKDIIAGENIEVIFKTVLNDLYRIGPTSTTDMEILSYLFLYHPVEFEKYKTAILNYMAVFYKNIDRDSLKDVIFGQYRKYIRDTYNKEYTPIQASVIKGIDANKCFSFSAPTSTGKSYVFMNKIQECQNDVVVVVPSRALINEYYLKLCDLIQDKAVNILTFIDKINTKKSKRNIFIVTPERCRELFKQKDLFNVELFLFDEAQLSNEDSKRGLYFDSIVRRCLKAYPDATYVFAHPFVKNPESQIEKNHFNSETSFAIRYTQKNVGQMFLCRDNNWKFYHFGIDTSIMGRKKRACNFDPIEKTILNNGSVLFYISKSKIYNKEFLKQFDRYISLCTEIEDPRINDYIEKIKLYTGSDTAINKNHYSQMTALLKRGIVIHHGSLPLQTRIIIEQFTKEGFCRICFATSTLEQGINMPFDVVYLDRLEASKPLSVKNLIGRAGRSTLDNKFDFGYVIINSLNNRTKFREVMTNEEELDNVSILEKEDQQDDDYTEFKEAILNGTLSDEFNLTENELAKLSTDDIETIAKNILDSLFIKENFISLDEIRNDEYCRLSLYSHFKSLYEGYLGRSLNDGESNVLNTAIKIIIWRVYGKTFKNMCWYRYSHASKSHERDAREKSGKGTDDLMAHFFTGYNDIPNKNLNVFSLFPMGTKAKDVDYDIIMYDTYDYIDKLIGFKLSDVFYATFFKYFEKTNDTRALKLAKYIKYGTDEERYIWMLRYGLSFEDIEVLDKHIDRINSEGILFKKSINDITEEQKVAIIRYL